MRQIGIPRLTLVTRLGALGALLLLTGCAAQLAAENREKDNLLVTGNYNGAALQAENRMGLKSGKDGQPAAEVSFKAGYVLDHLEAAEAWRLAGEVDRAIAHYEAAEKALTDVDTQNAAEGAARQAGAVLLNDTMISYRPSPAEAVLINYYKSLSFWQQGRPDSVRVELNRADDRIRRAVEHYAREIEEAQKTAEESKTAELESASTAVADAISPHFPEMAHWRPYEDFVVPPASYLRALYLGRSQDPSDLQKGRDTMGRVVGITRNTIAVQDLAELKRGRLCPSDDCVWVIAEHGQGPHLVERRFDLPLPTSSGLLTLSMALPALESRTTEDLPPFQLLHSGTVASFSELASMDRIVQTEFTKRFPGIVTRATAGAAVKALAQHKVNKESGPMAGLVANILSIATTAADVRMWRATPGRFTVTRLQRPADGKLLVRHQGGVEAIELPASGAVLVHLKQPVAHLKPSIVAFAI